MEMREGEEGKWRMGRIYESIVRECVRVLTIRKEV